MRLVVRRAVAGIAWCLVFAGCANDGPFPDVASPAVQSTIAQTPDSSEAGHAAPPSGPDRPTDPSAPAEHSDPPRATVTVIGADNRFEPLTAVIAPGTEVVWVNRGRNDHDLISDSSLAFGAVAANFGPGDEYRFVFTEPGEYPYHCTIHGTAEIGMVGTIFVTEQTEADETPRVADS